MPVLEEAPDVRVKSPFREENRRSYCEEERTKSDLTERCIEALASALVGEHAFHVCICNSVLAYSPQKSKNIFPNARTLGRPCRWIFDARGNVRLD